MQLCSAVCHDILQCCARVLASGKSSPFPGRALKHPALGFGRETAAAQAALVVPAVFAGIAEGEAGGVFIAGDCLESVRDEGGKGRSQIPGLAWQRWERWRGCDLGRCGFLCDAPLGEPVGGVHG